MVARLTRRTFSPAPLIPTRLTSMLLPGAIGATSGDMTTFFDLIALATTNPPIELPHTLLTALARVARWTGFYARGLDALARGGASTTIASMAFDRAISRYAPPVTP